MPFVRKSASAAPPAPAPDLAEGLSSPNEEVRWNAARAAAGTAQCAPALATALRTEPVARVREALLTSLVRIGTADSVAAVLPLLRSDDASLRTGALDALRLMIRNTRELLPPLLQDVDVDVRILSCELARMLPGEEASPLLCELLRREPDVNVCAAAVEVLAEVGQSDALPVLNACAAKFHDTPFLVFAIQVTADRIGTGPARSRG